MNASTGFHRVPRYNAHARAYVRTLAPWKNSIPRALDRGTWRNLG